MANQTIPQRSEVPEEYTWNLKDLYESDQAWNEEYKALKALPEQITAFRGTLGRSAEDLLAWFRLQDQVEERLSRLYGYASCKGDEDTGNGFYQGMRSKALATLVAIDAASAFETPEIMALDEDTVNLFYAAQPELETYRRNIYKIRRRKAHILSPEEEKLLSAAGEMANGPENIASVFRDADLTFPAVTDGEGNERVLTSGTFVPLLMGSDRVLRKNAFEAYYNRFGEFKNTVAAALDGQFRSLKFFSDARHYPSTRAAALDVTEVPEEVYDNLIEAVHAKDSPTASSTDGVGISACGYGFLAVNRYYRQTWLTTPYYAGYMSHPDEQLYMKSGNSNAGGSAYVKLQENSNNYVYLDSSRADIGSSGTARILAPKFAIGTNPSSGGTYGYTGSTQFIGCITNNGNNWTWGTINVVNGIITGMSSITGN